MILKAVKLIWQLIENRIALSAESIVVRVSFGVE
jgi:hypothetical protein